MANRIRVVLAEKKMTAKQLADSMECCNAAVMSYIMNDKALPTKEGLKQMCEVLSCRPDDLFDAMDADLLGTFESEQRKVPAGNGEEHGVWFSLDDVDSMKRAVINLSEVILHEGEAN